MSRLRCQSKKVPYHCDGYVGHGGLHYFVHGPDICKTWTDAQADAQETEIDTDFLFGKLTTMIARKEHTDRCPSFNGTVRCHGGSTHIGDHYRIQRDGSITTWPNENRMTPKNATPTDSPTPPADPGGDSPGVLETAQPLANRYGVDYRYDLLDSEFIYALACIAHYGANKYGDTNWQKSRLTGGKGPINHLEKHLADYKSGADYEHSAVGTHRKYQLAAIAFNAMMEFWYETNFPNPQKGS